MPGGQGTHTEPLGACVHPAAQRSWDRTLLHPDWNAFPGSLNLPAGYGKHALRFACPASGW